MNISDLKVDFSIKNIQEYQILLTKAKLQADELNRVLREIKDFDFDIDVEPKPLKPITVTSINSAAEDITELLDLRIRTILTSKKNPEELALIPGLVDAYLSTSLRSLPPGGLKKEN